MTSCKTYSILWFAVSLIAGLYGTDGYREVREPTSLREGRDFTHAVSGIEANADEEIVPIDPTAILASMFPVLEEQSQQAKEIESVTEASDADASRTQETSSETEKKLTVPPKLAMPVIMGVMTDVESASDAMSEGYEVTDRMKTQGSGGMYGSMMPASSTSSPDSMAMMMPTKTEEPTVTSPPKGALDLVPASDLSESLIAPDVSPKEETMEPSELELAVACIPAHVHPSLEAPQSTSSREKEDMSEMPEVPAVGSGSPIAKARSVESLEEASASSISRPEAPPCEPEPTVEDLSPKEMLEEPSIQAPPSSESVSLTAHRSESSEEPDLDLLTTSKTRPIDKIEMDASVEHHPSTPTRTSHRIIETPLHLSSASVHPASVTEPPSDGEASHAHTDRNNHGFRISHGAKLTIWVLVGVCLFLIVVGNAFGVYFTYIQPRLRRSASIDLFVLDV